MPKSNKHNAIQAPQPRSKRSTARQMPCPASRRESEDISAVSARRNRRLLHLGVGALVLLGAVAGLFVAFKSGAKASNPTGGSGPTYVVGSPGPGTVAPPLQLPSTSSGTFDLAAYRGQRVLLYFQEGVTCQPCWTQLQAIDANLNLFKTLGISHIESIAIDPVSALASTAKSYSISTTVLADPTGRVSSSYHANNFGMMNGSEDGHSFILVGRSGKIRWRADFGGPPHYTMYVPVNNLMTDMRAALSGASS